MAIYSFYIIAKSGQLMFNYEHNFPKVETEKVFSYPMDVKLHYKNHRTTVVFGQRDGIFVCMSGPTYDFPSSNDEFPSSADDEIPSSEYETPWSDDGISSPDDGITLPDGMCPFIGQTLLSVNGVAVQENRMMTDKPEDVFDYLSKPENYPVTCRFGRARMETNENLAVGSVFYSVFALASQLSPEVHSSGIQYLETETFKLHCLQTLTGVKFFLISDPKLQGMDAVVRKIYELYSDYVLKNPFYALDQPIRCELFVDNLKSLLENVEKTGITNV